jgi:hypothetical protein
MAPAEEVPQYFEDAAPNESVEAMLRDGPFIDIVVPGNLAARGNRLVGLKPFWHIGVYLGVYAQNGGLRNDFAIYSFAGQPYAGLSDIGGAAASNPYYFPSVNPPGGGGAIWNHGYQSYAAFRNPVILELLQWGRPTERRGFGRANNCEYHFFDDWYNGVANIWDPQDAKYRVFLSPYRRAIAALKPRSPSQNGQDGSWHNP